MNKHMKDKIFQTGEVYFMKRKNSRMYIIVPEEGDSVIIKLKHLSSKKIDDYSIFKGTLLGNSKRNVMTTYLRMDKLSFVAFRALSEQAITDSFPIFLDAIKNRNP